MQKFLIIDGNAIVHRAFHAFPPLTNTTGQPVNAVYGFFSILIKSLDEVKPDALAICFDRPAPTFRKMLYAGYQAHRPKMADGLSEQMTVLQEALTKIGIPIYSLDGYEADDIIGTLARQAAHEQRDVIILTGDRDLLQLVNTHIKVLAPVVGITKFIFYDESTVLEKYGVKPAQVTDYKALVGDSSDGYPGVTGIGPKTARDLLKTYGSFENVYKHLAGIPEKTAIKLATDAEQAALAKKLATIDTQAPVTLDLGLCSLSLFSQEKVASVFDIYSFTSLKKRLGVFNRLQADEKSPEGKRAKKDQLALL